MAARGRWAVLTAGGALSLALAGGAAGCGSGGQTFANDPRPPATITVTAAIDRNRVRVSPTSFGAGPVVVIVSNQSGAPQQVTFETDEVAGIDAGIRKSVGPVPAGDTAELQADPREGTYRLAVRDRAIKPAAVKVGPRRRSAQDQLMQP